MSKVVYKDKDYKIVKCYSDYVLINRHGSYKNHGHFKSDKACKKLISLMKKKVVPYSKYFQGSVLRISLDKKYKDRVRRKQEKNKNKQKYININKGC